MGGMPGLTTAAKPTHWGGLRAPIPARYVEPSRRCDLTRSPAPTCGLPRYQSLTTSPAAFRDGPRPHVTSHDLARRAAISRDLLSPRATSRDLVSRTGLRVLRLVHLPCPVRRPLHRPKRCQSLQGGLHVDARERRRRLHAADGAAIVRRTRTSSGQHLRSPKPGWRKKADGGCRAARCTGRRGARDSAACATPTTVPRAAPKWRRPARTLRRGPQSRASMREAPPSTRHAHATLPCTRAVTPSPPGLGIARSARL